MELSTEILIMLCLLMFSIMGGHFLKKKHHRYLQESGLTTLIGVAAGLIMKFMNIENYLTNLSNHFVRLFMLVLLPPIIFESGFNMEKKHFFKNIGSIMLFAILGTCIAMFASAGMFYACGLYPSLGPAFSLYESMAFGSLISATDPVAVLAIFKDMNVDPTLYIIIFGESIFNDAISIVMYRTVHQAATRNEAVGDQLLQSFIDFCVIFMGSLLIGICTALICAFILKKQTQSHLKQLEAIKEQDQASASLVASKKKQKVNTEISLMILCPWVSYLIAEGFELSGIVAIMTNGIFLSYYAAPNINQSAREVLKTGYETVAHSAETIVFLFLGIALFAFNHPYEQMGYAMVFTTIVNLSISRLLNVVIVSFLVNKSRSENVVTKKFQFVIWLSGLRGAMAYALAIKSSFDYDKGPIILISTLLYAFISILLVGSILNPVFDKLDVAAKVNTEIQHVDGSSPNDSPGDSNSESQRLKKANCCMRFKGWLSRLEGRYIHPFFVLQEDHQEVNSALHQTEQHLPVSLKKPTSTKS